MMFRKWLISKADEACQAELSEVQDKLDKYALVSHALAARVEANEWIDRFQSLVYKDFIDFGNKENGANGAQSLKRLQDVLHQMRLIAQCPDLQTKTICALGGGFSSGKSAFANSFLTSSEVCLAENIEPTTAIPSYVIAAGHKGQAEQSSIMGVNWKGATFPIELEAYKGITHKLLESFEFNLNKIIFHILVQSPMNEDYFKNICLIDTPGYNPGGAGTSGNDFSAAQKYIKNADILIWFVNISVTGTIEQSDVDFLTDEGMEFGKTKPLYIIASRADEKPQSQIEEILDTFATVLDDNYIEYEGISAYSAHNKQCYASRKEDIYTFLAGHDKSKMKYQELREMITDVFSTYTQYIHKDYNENKRNRQKVKKVLLDALEVGSISVEDDSNKLEEGISGIMKLFKQDQSLDDRLDAVLALKGKFTECLDGFCEAMQIERTRVKHCPKCGAVMTGGVCPKCGGRGLSSSSTVKFTEHGGRRPQPSGTIKCPECGNVMKATAQFCAWCGTKIGG